MVDSYCENCAYQGKVGDMLCCNYIFETEHRRPCPAGTGCTVKLEKKKSRRKNAKNSAIDEPAKSP